MQNGSSRADVTRRTTSANSATGIASAHKIPFTPSHQNAPTYPGLITAPPNNPTPPTAGTTRIHLHPTARTKSPHPGFHHTSSTPGPGATSTTAPNVSAGISRPIESFIPPPTFLLLILIPLQILLLLLILI